MTRNGTSQVLQRRERLSNLRLERQETRRQDEAANDQRFAENMALDAGRGELIAPPAKRGDPRKPQRRQTGLELVLSRGVIQHVEAVALRRYGDDYRAATIELTLKSGLDFTIRGGVQVTDEAAQKRATAQKEAMRRLEDAQNNGLGGQSDLMRACNLIAGQQKTPREAANDAARQAERLTWAVGVAGALLVRHYQSRPQARGHTTA